MSQASFPLTCLALGSYHDGQPGEMKVFRNHIKQWPDSHKLESKSDQQVPSTDVSVCGYKKRMKTVLLHKICCFLG